MTQLDLSPPRPVPGGELKEAIRREVLAALLVYARGRAAAITGERLGELVGLRLLEGGHQHALALRTLMRRCQEAVVELIEAGEPVASSSRPPLGYWWAETADELEESLRECEQRARMTLKRRRALRGALAKLRGQVSMRGVA